MCTTHAKQSAVEPVGKRLSFKRHKRIPRYSGDQATVEALASQESVTSIDHNQINLDHN